MKFPYVGEFFELVAVCVPTRVERQDVVLEHSLKETDCGVSVVKDQPVLLFLAPDHLEAQLRVEAL